jgi:hypothetical protein
MQSPIYLLSWVAGACSFWFLWSLGIKKLFLDAFRERLFELRFELFRLGISGELPFDNETYRTLETLICGLLRYGHRITFLTYVFSVIEQERAKKDKSYVDVSQQIALKISRLDSKTQSKLGRILKGLSMAINLYMAFTSLFFLSIFSVYKVAKFFGIWQPVQETKQISFVVEREAYRAESLRPVRLAAA